MYEGHCPVELTTAVRISCQELTPQETQSLAKQLNLNRHSHKFTKIIKRNPANNSIQYLYEILEKHKDVSPRNSAKEKSGKNEAVTLTELDKNSLMATIHTRSKENIRKSRSPSVQSCSSLATKDRKTIEPYNILRKQKTKIVSKQIKEKQKKTQDHSNLNIFKTNSLSGHEDPQSQISNLNSEQKESANFTFYDDNQNAAFITKMSESSTKPFLHDVKAEYPPQQNIHVDPETLAKVSRTVDLLSELHGIPPLEIIKTWLRIKNIDQVKIELAINNQTVCK